MTTTVVITTTEGASKQTSTLTVTDAAQKHVLRSFNPDSNPIVDDTKVLCAALIQQMINLRDAPETPGYQKAAAMIGLRAVEDAQMHCVKANFVQA